MQRCCIIIHNLHDSSESPQEGLSLWATMRSLGHQQSDTTLLHTGTCSGLERERFSSLAAASKLSYHHVDEFLRSKQLPLLPANPCLLLNRSILEALRHLECEQILFWECPEHAASFLQARRCGRPGTTASVSLLLSSTRPNARMRLGRFPSGGRTELCADLLERQALTLADQIVSPQQELLGELTPLLAPSPVPPFVLFTEPPQAAHKSLSELFAPPPHPRPSKSADQRVSICIPYFNKPAFLKETLASLAQQSATPFEIIIVDDGSEDSEAAGTALKNSGLKNARLFRQANAGPAAARNHAAKEAKGELLLFCDADNRFDPEFLTSFLLAQKCSGASVLTCAFSVFRQLDDQDRPVPEYLYAPLGSALELGLLENCLGDSNFLIDRELFLSLGGFPEHNKAASEDWEFLLGLLQKGHDLATIPDPLFHYRLSENSHSHRHTELESAWAALQASLASLPAVWQNLWPHLAGLVRQALDTQQRSSLEQARASLADKQADLLLTEIRQRSRIDFLTTELDRLSQAVELATAELRQSTDERHAKQQQLLESKQLQATQLAQLSSIEALYKESAQLLAEEKAINAELSDSFLKLTEAQTETEQRLDKEKTENTRLSKAYQNSQEAAAAEQVRFQKLVQSLQSRHSELQEHCTQLTAERDRALHGERSLRAKHSLLLDSLAKLKISIEELARHQQTREQAWLTETARHTAQLAQLSERLNELASELNSRDDKIRRMQESFSWKITTPLRALRRLTLDRWKNRTQPAAVVLAAKTPETTDTRPPSSPAAPTHKSAVQAAELQRVHGPFRFHIDAPRSWKASDAHVAVRGWCFSESKSTSFTAIRALVDGTVYSGTYGLPRADLGLAFPDFSQALNAGFHLDLHLSSQATQLSLELLDTTGLWIPFLLRPLGVEDPSQEGSYAHWVAHFDTPCPLTLKALTESSNAWPVRPLVSLLMPVYNTPEKWLRKVVSSVQEQSYTNWELCIANDASPAPHLQALLDELASTDGRLKVVHLPKNGHICAATNAALELASGELCALLDHDDELAPHALHCLVSEFLIHPQAELVYSDEDKIDEQGVRFDPHFKPDWNPDLLTSQNYICHFAGMRTATLRNLGGLRPGLEGSQDWDLFLRLTRSFSSAAVRHIPRVLYHWRAIAGSTALHTSEKDYISDSARKALEDHFSALAIKTSLSRTQGGHWHVRWPLPEAAPLVSIIIPTKNGATLVRQCLNSLFARTSYHPYEVLLIDNRSDDPEALSCFKEFTQRDGVRLISYDQPFNYSALNNFAATHARGDVLCLLNNDIEVLSPDWLGEMVAQALRPEIGAVGARLYYPDSRIQHAGVITGLGGVAGHAFKNFTKQEPGMHFRPHLTQNLSAVTAACLVVRKAVFDEVGGLNDKELAIAFNDVDFCLKVQAKGYRNLYAPAAELFHHESASRGSEDSPEKIRRFQGEILAMQRLWGESLLSDPAYNPNLSLDAEDFSLAYPPRLPPLHALPPA